MWWEDLHQLPPRLLRSYSTASHSHATTGSPSMPSLQKNSRQPLDAKPALEHHRLTTATEPARMGENTIADLCGREGDEEVRRMHHLQADLAPIHPRLHGQNPNHDLRRHHRPPTLQRGQQGAAMEIDLKGVDTPGARDDVAAPLRSKIRIAMSPGLALEPDPSKRGIVHHRTPRRGQPPRN